MNLPGMKQAAPSYFAWGLNVCLCGGASGMFIDLIPEDGCLRDFGADEETLLGQSLERMAASRFRGFGTVSRVQCGDNSTPEVFYVAVAHAVRTIEAAVQTQKQREEREAVSKVTVNSEQQKIQQQQPQQQQDLSNPNSGLGANVTADGHVSRNGSMPGVLTSSAGSVVDGPNPFQLQHQQQQQQQQQSEQDRRDIASTFISPHVLIIQDVDRAPARTLECLTEMLVTKTLSAPPGTTGGVLPEMLQLPPHFVVVASSSRAPRPSTTTNFNTEPSEGRLSDRLLNGFLLRIPIILPRTPPAQSIAPQKLTRADLKSLLEAVPKVHLNASIVKYVRDSVSAVRAHPLVACGLPPRAADILCLAIRTQAALRGSRFAIPEDLTNCVIEVLAHRIIVAPSEVLPTDFTEEHPVYLARLMIAAAISQLPVIR